MHIVLVIVLWIAFCVLTAVCFFLLEDRKKRFIFGILSLMMATLLMSWWISANCEPWVGTNTFYEVKEVIWPDGTKAQMFNVNGKNHNITEMFGKFVDEKQWHVKGVQWQTSYRGISYSGTSERLAHDGCTYFLEKKNGEVAHPLPKAD